MNKQLANMIDNLSKIDFSKALEFIHKVRWQQAGVHAEQGTIQISLNQEGGWGSPNDYVIT